MSRGYTDTHMGRLSRAGKGVESRDRLGDERTEGVYYILVLYYKLWSLSKVKKRDVSLMNVLK